MIIPDQPSAAIIDMEHEPAAYRSGAAARLAGVPVETLRVWERRYGVTAPCRSVHGQRLYSLAEIRRLSLVKQLVDVGNQIGTIAQLPDEQLTSMLAIARAQLHGTGAAPETQAPVRIALVGQALAMRISDCQHHAIDIVASCSSISNAAKALHAIAADVVVIELAEMTQPSLSLIAEIRDAVGAQGVVVLYRFCSSGTIRQLREAGHVVAHAPSDAAEIALLCRCATGRAMPLAAPSLPLLPAPARRFDDQALQRLALAANSVACECPRHLAEILMTINSFERYSAQCENNSEADAALHRYLQQGAAQARALLEEALERVVQH